MCCATKIDHATTTGPMPLGLIARRAKRWIGEGPCPHAESRRAAAYPHNIVRPALADSENIDPEHVWGDEGPVND